MVQRRKTKPVSGRRLHYIAEWAKLRGLSQAAVQKALAADWGSLNKSTVSRWFNGITLPEQHYLVRLAELFDLPEPAALFRDPDLEWAFVLLNDQTSDELLRIRAMLEAGYSKKTPELAGITNRHSSDTRIQINRHSSGEV